MNPEKLATSRAQEGAETAPREGRGERAWAALKGVDGTAPPGWMRPGPSPEGFRADILIGVGAAILVAVINIATLESGILDITGPASAQPLWLGIAMPFLIGAAVACRRQFPITAFLGATAATYVAVTLGYLEVFVTPNLTLFLFYSAGAWSNHRALVTVARLAVAVAQTVVGVTGALTRDAIGAETIGASEDFAFGTFTIVLNVVLYAAVFWLGNSQYLRAGQWATMLAQFEELQRSRAQLADQAVRLDRIRIARELHDSVAHHVSLMGVQAAVGRKALDKLPDLGPDRASELAGGALAQVESNAREAIEELQGILVALRSEEGGETRDAPSTRTLGQVPALIDSATGAGMTVAFHEYGERPRSVSAIAELTVYRVLQEALTNVRKHAGANAGVDVRLRFGSDAIELDVTDDGLGHRGSRGDGGGRGLTGMQERALAVGGTVQAGPREPRGFRVLLRVPLRAAPPGASLPHGNETMTS